MDITGIDIAGLLAGLGAFLKSIHSDSKTKAISEDRAKSKENFDGRFVKLETRCDNLEKRMDEGLDRFQSIDDRLDKINETLSELKGMFKVYMAKMMEDGK